MTHTHIPILLLAVLLLTSCTNATVAPTATSTHFPSTPAWTDTPETIIPSLAALTTTQAASNLQPPATTQAQAFTSTPKKIQPATPSIVELGDDGMQIDSHSMIFIPPGEFTMGAPVLDATIANNDEKPEHSVYLDGFWIDQLEVTNAIFAVFLNEMGNRIHGGVTWLDADSDHVRIHLQDGVWQVDPGFENHPVVEVTWFGADSYCKWAGKRLPTEAEWEKAARSADGRTYPWGEEIHCGLANYRGCVGDTVPVGSYLEGASPYGILDMAGNASEWVADWYAGDYYSSTPVPKPAGPSEGLFRVVRGGNCLIPGLYLRVTFRDKLSPAESGYFTGFRCAQTP